MPGQRARDPRPGLQPGPVGQRPSPSTTPGRIADRNPVGLPASPDRTGRPGNTSWRTRRHLAQSAAERPARFPRPGGDDVTDAARPAAVSGLNRSDPRGPGLSRVRDGTAFAYLDVAGGVVADPLTLGRIRALAIPPAWTRVWISPDPLGHIQATGVDSRGRVQYRYHQRWREHRDEQKFAHMLRFSAALPVLRAATLRDLRHRGLGRSRVAAAAVRLIDL